MTLLQMSYLLEIERCGSINRAAQHLFVSQSALSNAIAEVERELGITVFHRSNRGIALTDEGRTLLSQIAPIVERSRKVSNYYSERKAENRVRLSIAAQRYPFCVKAFVEFLHLVMHHGTIMFDSDLSIAGLALTPDPEKIAAKGVKSVRSRMTTVSEHLSGDITLAQFKKLLLEKLFEGQPMEEYKLTESDIAAIEKLRDERYGTWEWNYGGSPACDLTRKKRVDGCGTVECRFHVKEGRITQAAFRGDFFSAKDPALLAKCFVGLRPVVEDYQKALEGIDVSEYFSGLNNEALLDILS